MCIIVTGDGLRDTACVRAETQSGGTALMYAAASGRAECVRLLLEDGADQEALNNVRTSTKTQLRNKWRDSENAALQIGLMKLMATDEERKRLSTSFMETRQQHIAPDLSNLTTEQIIELLGNDPGTNNE